MVNCTEGDGEPPSRISSSTVGPPSSLSVFPSISNVFPTMQHVEKVQLSSGINCWHDGDPGENNHDSDDDEKAREPPPHKLWQIPATSFVPW
nr:E3 ubiquitin-protein ligase RHF1A-like isoform X3 [Ipomoea trifida]